MKPYAIILALALCGVSSQAQNLTTEITVDSEAELSLPEASPLKSVSPSLIAVEAPDINLSPARFSQAVDFTPQPGFAPFRLYSGLREPDKRRGYLWAGYFPAYNLGVAAGYRFIDTKSTTAGIAADFHGYSYSSPISGYNEKHHATDNTVGVQAYGRHTFSPLLRLGADISYFHAGLSAPTVWNSTQKQGIDAFDLALSLDGNAEFDYKVKLAYSRFGLNKDIAPAPFYGGEALKPASDDRFRADLGAGAKFGPDSAQRVSLDFSFDLLHRHGNQPDAFVFEPVRHASSAILTFVPNYTFSYKGVSVKVGVRFDIGINSPDKAFHVTPDIMASWSPATAFTVYGTVGGGERFRTLRDRYSYSPFAPGLTASSRSFTPFDARVGLLFRPMRSLHARIWAGYSSVRRMPMLTVYRDMVTYVPVGLHGWTLGLEAGYSFGKYADVSLSTQILPHSYTGGSALDPDRAKFVLEAKVASHPTDKLTLEASYTLRSHRRYYTYSVVPDGDGSRADHTAVNMGNISDLAIGADYAIASNFNVFLRFDNLLCRRVLIMPSVASQRLHGLAGVSLRF